jgi:hypothetical protein
MANINDEKKGKREDIEVNTDDNNIKKTTVLPKKNKKKYKVVLIFPNRIILKDANGNGTGLPLNGNEKLKIGDTVELEE